MQTTKDVDVGARTKKRVVSTKYPLEKIKLLEAIQARRGDRFISDTISEALDRLVEEHFPGATDGSA